MTGPQRSRERSVSAAWHFWWPRWRHGRKTRRSINRRDGKVAGSFGGNGRYAGQLHWIEAVAVDSKGNVYTGEVEDGKRIQNFVLTNGR
jgi:hypothetical protein